MFRSAPAQNVLPRPRITKLAANRGLDGDTETLIALESMTCNVAHQSQDAKEGVQAFLEKRDPVWKHA